MKAGILCTTTDYLTLFVKYGIIHIYKAKTSKCLYLLIIAKLKEINNGGK